MIEREVRNCLSVCCVRLSTYNDNYVLQRLADIVNGEIVKPKIDPDEPKIFGNRITLYKKDGPDQEGYIGIWNWSAFYNISDSSKDYVEARFEPAINFIEVVNANITGQTSNNSIIAILKEGIISDEMKDILFVGKISDHNEYKAVYLRKKNQNYVKGRIVLKPSELKIPYYTIPGSDFIEIEKRIFYKYTSIKQAINGFIPVKQPYEVVKELFLEKLSWQDLKLQGISRNTYRQIKEYIESIESESIIKQLMEKLDCTEQQAIHYINAFIESSSKIMDGQSVNDSILLSLIERNSELSSKVDELSYIRWKAENQQLLDSMKLQLVSLDNKKANLIKEIEQYKKDLAIKQSELAETNENIIKTKELNDEMSRASEKGIQEIKSNMSGFIADMALLSALYDSQEKNRAIPSGETDQSAIPSPSIEPDINETWKNELQTLESELSTVGIDDGFVPGLAATIYSCFVHGFPIMLAGPFGDDIAKAISVSIFGKYPRFINAATEYDDGYSDIEGITVIQNPFLTKQRDVILNRISHTSENCFYILTTPVFEDLKIEPGSILDYFYPIDTSMFLAKRPGRNFVGGKRTSTFIPYKCSNKQRFRHGKLMKEMKLSNYSASMIMSIAEDAREMNDALTENYDYLFCLITIGAMTGSEEKVIIECENDIKVDKDTRSLCELMLGE